MSALTWKEARSLLRELLEDYIKNEPSPPVLKPNQNAGDSTEEQQRPSLLSRCMACWLANDMDLYAGALTLSTALLILTCFSWASSSTADGSALHAQADQRIYHSQFAAAILLVMGALLSIWVVQRRHLASSRDIDSVKRREIQRFLKSMEKLHASFVDGDAGGEPQQPAPPPSQWNDEDDLASVLLENEHIASASTRLEAALKLPGTALTDIYPVYRFSTDRTHGAWSRIPTLLLVEGDFVALQVGDIAPARCRLANSQDGNNSLEIGAGERIILDKVAPQLGMEAGDAPAIAGRVMAGLPKGRTTLPAHSEKLLTLCNNMQVMVLLESPLKEFLRRPQVQHQLPMVLRQLQAIRGAFSITALFLLVATTAILFARPGTPTQDLSLLLPLPFLASLGVLPVAAPMFFIFLEIFGTSKILVTVHPHACVHHRSTTGNRTTNASVTGSTTGKRSGGRNADKLPLLTRYFLATTLSRLSLWTPLRSLRHHMRSLIRGCGKQGEPKSDFDTPKILRVPPASVYLLENLGVATAFTLVDDELACEPHAVPQQLLIPSGKVGLKLLDMCPVFEDDDSKGGMDGSSGRKHGRAIDTFDHDSDTDSEDLNADQRSSRRRFRSGSKKRNVFHIGRKRRRLIPTAPQSIKSGDDSDHSLSDVNEVQFEDPNWWQHLPALKCIGLACLIVDDKAGELDEKLSSVLNSSNLRGSENAGIQTHISTSASDFQGTKQDLVRLLSAERRSNQLRALAHCIGFSSDPNSFGGRGDLSPFTQCLRLHVISHHLVKERLEIDPHERGSEESRWWGLLRPDSTSVIIHDARSYAYQMLTVGDPQVVTSLCHEAWQGENSTILPLSSGERESILDTSRSWKLADLDVSAFSYAPVPHTVEKRLGLGTNPSRYLLDSVTKSGQKTPISLKDRTLSEDWSLINNQIFLGVLGSLVVPRKEIQRLLNILSTAGVRFVYFSPRNMRRQKELASQMGIDVAWNCAISLRPLESGEDDPHRMVSNYADWDVNAKLPHGIENVRKHLREVDNVPLLVSLFTDVTKQTTMEMVETFQEYHDTVIAVGLSHLPRNSGIFSTADFSVGIDVLTESIEQAVSNVDFVNKFVYNTVLPSEVTFVSAISAHSCVFRLRGASAMSHIPRIIAQGRASLEAAISAGVFYSSGCLSFSFYVLFSACTISTCVPYVPFLGAVLHIIFCLPLIGFTMAWSDPDKDIMRRVPPKNDQTVTFGREEGWRLCKSTILKAFLPALFPHLLHLIAIGELMIAFEPDFVHTHCSESLLKGDWPFVIRCNALKNYSGPARTSAGAFVLAEFILCTAVASAAFVHGTIPVRELSPLRGNRVWAHSVTVVVLIVVVVLVASVESGSFSALPWYFYLLAVFMPPACLVWNEACKQVDRKHDLRSEKLRRLQFETRLGMWSPK